MSEYSEIVKQVEELYQRVDERWFALYSLYLYKEQE